MTTFREMQQLYANIGTIGQQIKKQSDDAMEATWDNLSHQGFVTSMIIIMMTLLL